MNKNKRIIIGIIVVAVIFVTAFVVWQAYRKPIITIEPPERVSPSDWTPFREEWPAMVEKISIWQNGKERIIEFGNLENPNPEYLEIGRILLPTLHKLNLQARCAFSEERIQKIKRKNKVVEIVFKQADDFPISQWVQEEERYHIPTDEQGYRILENLKSAVFVLEDSLDEGMEGHILVASERKDRDKRCSWKITREDLEKLGPGEAVVGYYYGEKITGIPPQEYGCIAISGREFDSEIVPFKTAEECEFACGRMWGCWAIQQEESQELDKSWIEEINKIE